MNPQYINRTLMPEDQPSKQELEREEIEQKALSIVRQTYNVDEVFDLYENDKEVVKAFLKWLFDTKLIRDGENWYLPPMYNEQILGELVATSLDELWEYYCTANNLNK